MDIVDSQIHSNVLGTETTLAIMDAIGIQAAVIDEYLRPDENGSLLPGYRLAHGGFRPVGPSAEAAAMAHPDRFAYLMRIDPSDTEVEGWIETLALSPNLRALRVIVFTPTEAAMFAEGGLDRLFAAAHAHNLTLFVTCPGRVPLLARYAKKFPDMQIVIDHCGAAFGAAWGEGSIDDTVAMAEYRNVGLKWAHAPSFLSAEPYPFHDLEPKLKRAVDAFGPERIVWASDYTVSRHRQNWAESLFYMRHSPVLSETDKEWILGRSLRSMLNWPAPEHPAEPEAMHPHRLGPKK